MRKVKTDNSDLIQYLYTGMNTVGYVLMIFHGVKFRNLSLNILNFAEWIKRENPLLNVLLMN